MNIVAACIIISLFDHILVLLGVIILLILTVIP